MANQLEPLGQLIAQVPNLRGVIDHLAKPPIAAGEMEPWRSRIRHPRLRCKLSGMVTEAVHTNWKPDDYRPKFDRSANGLALNA